jgi:hypothetical protein
MEAKLNNSENISCMQQSQAESKRVFRRRRVDATKRAAATIQERDENINQRKTIWQNGYFL